jgi:hypothetical protein
LKDWKPAACPVPTRWAGSVDPTAPHPEHPRPQLVRPEWRSLNGVYECAIRPRSEGRPLIFDEAILVPFPVESALSGVARQVTADDRIWYRRSFTAPRAPVRHTWLLHFGAVDWRAEVWVDGRALGTHEGGFEPFSFDVGVLGGEHELVVAVWDPTDAGPQPRGKQALNAPLTVRPVFYTPASGIWQTVWLELVPTTRVEALRLEPRGDELRVFATVVGARGGERLRVTALVGGEPLCLADGDAGAGIALEIPDPRRWSPADPFLYDLDVQVLRDGEVIDRASSYFGMREVEIRRDARGALRFHLNGEPILLHGLLDQGYWPEGIFTAPSDEAMRFDLEETQRLGFNLVRKHVKVEPARWYWHCDRMGLLVIQDMPSGDRMTWGIPIGGIGPVDAARWLGAGGIRRTPESKQTFERELEAMLATLHNHPSIVMWVPFNEGWGQFDAARIAGRVAEVDPTRPVDAASGWVDPGNGDVRDVHVYYPGPRMPARRDPQRAEVLGEWGGLGLVVDGRTWPRRPFAYKILKDRRALEERYAIQLDSLEKLVRDGLAAAVWTQTTDVEGEVNGLLTYDRAELKLDADWLIERNRRIFTAFAEATRSA